MSKVTKCWAGSDLPQEQHAADHRERATAGTLAAGGEGQDSAVRVRDSLAMCVRYAGDRDTGKTAVEATLKLAEVLRRTDAVAVRGALEKAVSLVKDQNARRRMERLLGEVAEGR